MVSAGRDADAGLDLGEVVDPAAADADPLDRLVFEPERGVEVHEVETPEAGGEMLFVEATRMKGGKGLALTGQLKYAHLYFTKPHVCSGGGLDTRWPQRHYSNIRLII